MIASVSLCCGRHCLFVAGIVVAMEGDKCRSADLPEEVHDPIPPEELEHASIGGQSIREMPIEIVRFFRGDVWNKKMLEYVADKINTHKE